jgi:hypothetical protein
MFSAGHAVEPRQFDGRETGDEIRAGVIETEALEKANELRVVHVQRAAEWVVVAPIDANRDFTHKHVNLRDRNYGRRHI